jgi:glycosyltransferase involved in cell wall biosynthesis
LDVKGSIRTIAVCAAQVPFFSGGAEAHVGGLIEKLRLRGYEVELINLPYKWYPRKQMLNSIERWQKLDLSESNGKPIDLVIATKFPSYFIEHPRKVLWLIHQYRQMYDLLGTQYSGFDMHKFSDRRFRNKLVGMDTRALASFPSRFTNAQNTADRLQKFNGLHAQALYHPPPLLGKYVNLEYQNYILSVGRLDKLKRVDALLRALVHVDKSVGCKIAGTGPARQDLETLSRELGISDRVEFLGFAPDEQLVELYGKCSAVFFSPVDEDYGYITLEAFLSEKSVITAPDSGGPLEFVRHGVNGLIVDCHDTAALGRAISELVMDKDQCARMGQAGAACIANINWDNVIDTLIPVD